MRSGRLRTRLSILEAGTETGKLWADIFEIELLPPAGTDSERSP